MLLRKKAAEELKKEQERKAAERRKVIDERCGTAKDLDSASEGKNFTLILEQGININGPFQYFKDQKLGFLKMRRVRKKN